MVCTHFLIYYASFATFQKVVCKVTGAQQGDSLVLADLAFPVWEVTVNGKRSKWQTYKHCIRKVYLPVGNSTIDWKYKPLSFIIGISMSLISIVCLILILRLIAKFRI